MVRKIYRVEHRDSGIGPYRHNVDIMSETGWTLHTGNNGRPIPLDDGIDQEILYAQKHLFGFASKKKLKRWFKRFESWLRQNNFVVAIYIAKPEFVAHGKRQTAFIHGRKLKTLEISKVLK